MRKYLLALTFPLVTLTGAAAPASAQEHGSASVVVVQPDHSLRGSEAMAQAFVGGDERGGMMGRRGMMGLHGMMRPGPTGQVHSMMMRILFALMDGDGDGTISLPEFQAAHERLFKAMDSNKDGRLSLEEMQNFMHGSMRPTPPAAQ
jgi:hypothetical protein